MIKIYNNKLVYTNHRNKKKKIADDMLFYYLGDTVELDENLKFERIMQLLHDDRDLTNMVFGHTLGGYDFDLFYKDFMRKLPPKEAKEEKTNYKNECLEVYYYPDLFKYEKGERYEWNHSLDIHLMRELKGKKPEQLGIMFAKLAAFRKHKIRIKYEVDVQLQDSTVKITKKNFKKHYKPVIEAKLGGFRLFDFIWAILYEISWMGSPENRDSESKRISKISEDIESGKEKIIPMEEAMKEINKKIEGFKSKKS
jgi:hypothetical protein